MKNTKKTNTFLYLFFLFIIFNSFLVNASQEDIINLKYEFEPLNVNTLKRGDFGIDVAMLQAKLHYLNLYNDKIDGAFGLKTKNAVELFQKQNNLMITGIADKNTILKLNDLKLRVDLNYSLNDLMHLASLIYAEARGESYEGKIAVGAVVLNRVKSSLYPNTIKDVIMQNKQFSVVCDGSIYLKPNEIAINAALKAMLGYDPVNNSIYFFNPQIATDLDWTKRVRITKKIGNHVFAINK